MTELRDAQRAGKTFLRVFVRVVLDGTSIWIDRLSKEDILLNAVGIIQSIEGVNRPKGWRKDEFALCLSWDIILSSPWTSALLVLDL